MNFEWRKFWHELYKVMGYEHKKLSNSKLKRLIRIQSKRTVFFYWSLFSLGECVSSNQRIKLKSNRRLKRNKVKYWYGEERLFIWYYIVVGSITTWFNFRLNRGICREERKENKRRFYLHWRNANDFQTDTFHVYISILMAAILMVGCIFFPLCAR